jgi:hypothetical protein
VEYAYPLFSTTTTSGRSSTAAMLTPSWKSPVDVPPSPMYVIATTGSPRRFAASAIPAMTGMTAPRWEIGATMRRERSPKCVLPSRPPVGDVARAQYCVNTSRGRTPRTSIVPRLRIKGPTQSWGSSAYAVPTEIASWPSDP